ncbi:hypothetical protein [Roseisolibacter agri]|uniref:Uncharacterized protein n=1 Tax=Roseisolibacter agri TaxID=2014610 RepID=A0AA37Q927_9BACT|nr:hypothetical protein [Roseisolibacter agri]GLC28539.1 hypothetical protein rosag_50520 [Roseisolibacter agri]
MTAPTDTHRRAALRGRESVARWRLRGAVWAGGLYTITFAVLSVVPLLEPGGPEWGSLVVMVLATLGTAWATLRLRRGSRVAACALLGWFVFTKLASWLITGQPLWHGAIWTLIIGGALVNGVWGAFELARVARESADVPPAPAYATSRRLTFGERA